MRHLRSRPGRAIATTTENASGRKIGLRSLEIADRNFRVILEAIRRHGPLTRLELGVHCGLTGPGITNVLARLTKEGLVSSGRRNGEAGSGASSTEFALIPDGAMSIGLRLRPGWVEAVLVDLSGQVRKRLDLEAGTSIVDTVGEAVDSMTRASPTKKPVIGIGVATNHWQPELARSLAAALGTTRLFVENECVAAVLAERTIGAGVPAGGLAMIIIDDDIQAGFLVRGVPFAGVHGKAGSIGAMRTGPDHVRLDSIVGLKALRAILGEEEFKRILADEEGAVSPGLNKWVRDAAGHLLDPILAIAGFIAPSTIMIGGRLPRGVIEALIHQLSIERRDTTTRPFLTPWISPIKPASFSGGGVALGAALLPFLDTLLPPPVAG
jgi:predicted NBD/HSP70 family sugar kinase